MAHTANTFAAAELDRRIREAVAHTGSSTAEVRIARFLLAAEVVSTVEHALSTAARLDAAGYLPGQITRGYMAGGITYDLVNEAVAAAA
ncbi:hypothetical protein REPROBATE_21 [Mycobacterium phage Reprobate]|uniref:Uncharacterized protein n=1 Tax=Mycobacterium phage Reprobate TaxID=1340828 RepID=S5Y547_9CAUD|nr:hypothetical protein REPROBATE_21 [Mycobacterium phage Reprobate]AGT12757.1 hypothetical protein REPROBATE_21 [Mycobacterium phage Reprobate]